MVKYYSDVLKKSFDTEEECIKQEKEFEAKQELAAKEKKELADAVDIAEAEVAEAYEALDKAKADGEAIMREAREKVEAIVKPAKERLRKAQEAKLGAVKEFNIKCNKPYTRVLTGEEALKEINRTTSFLDDFFNFNNFWF